ncbi:hypothetical protein [Borrelia duttonii]|uniref:hypothetical protein n=1 Tax=Borrelia duttonii TaxID=40834 RepID=UPI00059AC6F8
MKLPSEITSYEKEYKLNSSTAKIGIDIINKFIELLQKNNNDKNTSTYTNIFLKVVNYIFSLYEASINRMEQNKAIKLLSELEEIIRINIKIIKNSNDYYNQDENAKCIST